MDLDAFLKLLTAHGQKALGQAVDLLAADTDRLAAATAMRGNYDAATTSAALTQAMLRKRAAKKFGDDAAGMYFTPDGVEQATRREVADHRARRLAGHGARLSVADVCCGIGGDLIALARRGCAVDAVDLDPLTAAVARANADALGLAVQVRATGAADVDPAAYDVVFADPARRRSGRGGRVFDPMAYSPSWPDLMDLVARSRAVCLKAAPGLPYAFVPEGAEVEWVSYRGEVKEAVLWLAGLAPGPLPDTRTSDPESRFLRRATLLPSGDTLVADPTLGPAETGPAGRYLYEPDGAAVRGHLVAEVAAMVGGRLLDPHIAYITSDTLVATPWASCYEISEMMPFSVKRLRAALRERRVGDLTVKKRGSAVDVDHFRREMRLSGDESAVVALTRIWDKPYALIMNRI